MAHTPATVILVPVPVGGSPKVAREVKPPRHHRAVRSKELKPPPQPIPKPNRQAVDALLQQGRRFLREMHPAYAGR